VDGVLQSYGFVRDIDTKDEDEDQSIRKPRRKEIVPRKCTQMIRQVKDIDYPVDAFLGTTGNIIPRTTFVI